MHGMEGGRMVLKKYMSIKVFHGVFSTSNLPYTLQRWNENRNVVLGGGRVGAGFVFIMTRYVASERASARAGRQAGR